MDYCCNRVFLWGFRNKMSVIKIFVNGFLTLNCMYHISNFIFILHAYFENLKGWNINIEERSTSEASLN